MFCPNCGTKNDDTATPCKKCGFKLSGASAPKFRGTMMLNSDQSVQDMVEEHRKKLAEAGQAPDAGGEPTPAPAPAVGSTPPKAVLQPPRAALPKRRMGTMLGVAPQVGGVRPPDEGPVATPPPPPASPPEVSPTREGTPPSAPDPLAGTVAFGAVSPAAAPQAPAAGLTSGRTEAFAAVPPAAATPPPALVAGRTEAFAAPPAANPPVAAAPAPAPLAPAPSELAAAAPLARGRTEAFEAPAAPAASAGAVAASDSAQSVSSIPPAAPQRRRVRPLDVFLIIITCGLYGLFLLARQRKPSKPA